MRRKNGFTFVELMVVIAIASILFAVATASFVSITKNSRDARRKADMEAVRQALELCRSFSGAYLAADSGNKLPGSIVCGGQTFMQKTPVDPKDDTTIYTYTSTATSYTLTTTKMENIAGCPPACTYSVTNP